jgi:hypothetical protein
MSADQHEYAHKKLSALWFALKQTGNVHAKDVEALKEQLQAELTKAQEAFEAEQGTINALLGRILSAKLALEVAMYNIPVEGFLPPEQTPFALIEEINDYLE